MSDAPAPSNAPAAPAKKRHPIERALVWGGIVVLLAVLGWEFSAREGYNRSMHDLEEAVQKPSETPLTAENVRQYVHGYAVWGETKYLNSKLITLKWPSLFKQYQFNLALDGNGVVRGVETELPKADSMDAVVHPMEAAASPQPQPAATEPGESAAGTETAPPVDAATTTPAESDPK